jgi:hypothetical protein
VSVVCRCTDGHPLSHPRVFRPAINRILVASIDRAPSWADIRDVFEIGDVRPQLVSQVTRRDATEQGKSPMEEPTISGVSHDRSDAKIFLVGVPDVVGRAALVFTAVADVQINVNLIAQSASVGSCGVVDISFTLPKVDLTRAVQVLDRHREVLGYTSLIADNEVGRGSIIGTGMRASPKLHAKFFSALTAAGLNVGMMSTSDIQLSVIVEANDVEITVRALSTAFSLDESSSTVEASPDHFWRSTELRAGHQRPPYYRSTRWTVDT